MDITSLLFPLLILLLFIPIFLSGRRQRRQMAEMQALQAALEPGDVVLTTSGLRATVVDSSYEETVDLEVADGVVTTWVRAAVKEKVAPLADPEADHGHLEAGEPDPVVASDKPSLEKRDLGKLEKLETDDSANGSTRA